MRVKFADLRGHRRKKEQPEGPLSIEDPNYDDDPESDPFKELRKKMKEE